MAKSVSQENAAPKVRPAPRKVRVIAGKQEFSVSAKAMLWTTGK